ncbi:hypothetical protein OG784_04915 [Streptomyces sp. NBC_01617]|uniref:hypothetical protein n=1 Tax=Streptomyces sp. NBC_01617 TaxID=2975899 RepID=UPI0038640B9B|nr:hypothetical protein OG784_04915 [Streptomyces sp. NBC_01617]
MVKVDGAARGRGAVARQAAAGFVARLCSTWQLTSSATNLEESALQTVQGLRGLRGQVGPQVGGYVAGHVHEADAQDGYGDAARSELLADRAGQRPGGGLDRGTGPAPRRVAAGDGVLRSHASPCAGRDGHPS